MTKTLILVLLAESWMTIGQLCLKKSADRLTISKTSAIYAVKQIFETLLRYPAIWIGALSMLLGLLFWLAALSSGRLSIVYALGSMQYILTLFGAHFFLKEKITPAKLTGTLLITCGIILTAFFK